MNTSKKVSLNDCINATQISKSFSEFVVIKSEGQPATGWYYALHGNWLTAMGNDHYKIKHHIARKLELVILCDWPIIIK